MTRAELANSSCASHHHIGGAWEAHDLDVAEVGRRGMEWVRTTCDGGGRWQSVTWSRDAYAIRPADDAKITDLAAKGVRVLYSLGLCHPADGHVESHIESHIESHMDSHVDVHVDAQVDTPQGTRFRSADDIERYLNVVQFAARHFRGRVDCYDVWNRPDSATPGWNVALDDYVDIARLALTIVREEDRDAKIAVGATGHPLDPNSQQYLLGIVASELMPIVDVVTWQCACDGLLRHDGDCADDEEYEAVVETIVRTASEHGFEGEYLSG